MSDAADDPVDEFRQREADRAAARRMLPYFVVAGMMSLGYGSIYTLLADLRDELGFSESQLGVVVGAGFFGGFFSQVFLSRYADRGYAALMVRAGLIIASGAMLATVFAQELWAFIGARLLLGLGTGMVGPAIRRVVIRQDPERIGANLGKQGAFDITGFVLGPLVAAVFKEIGGLRAPFAVLSVMFIGALLVALRLDLSAEAEDLGADRRVLRRLLAVRPMRAALCSGIAFYITIGMFEAVWAILLRDQGASTRLIGITLSLFTVPMIFLAPYGGRVAQARGPLRMASISIAVATLCTLSYGFISALWLLLFMSIVHAIADSYTMPANQVAVALSSPPGLVAAGQGLLGAVGVAVAGIVGVLAGVVYDSVGREALFSGTAIAMTVFLVLALVLGAELRRPVAVQGRPAATGH